MKLPYAVSLFLILCFNSYSQPNIEWQYSLGGTEADGIAGPSRKSLANTSDGGYIFAGYSYSNDGDVTGHHGSSSSADCWVVKLDSLGNIEWEKSLGGTNYEGATFILQTSDGGYFVVATTSSTNGDVTGFHTDTAGNVNDLWLVRLDSIGNIQWQNCFGGSGFEPAKTAIETYDGSFLVNGSTNSNDGDVTGNNGDYDIWIIKVSPTGSLLWQKCLGGTLADYSNTIKETPDSGFVIAGYTKSTDGVFTGADSSAFDSAFLMKVDSLANFQWVKAFGGSFIDWGVDVELTADGGYAMGCFTASSDIPGSNGLMEYWLLKLDDAGNLQWQDCYGGSDADNFRELVTTADNGLLLIGETSSSDGDVSNFFGGSSDIWIVKIDSIGNIEWEHSYGGTGLDRANTLLLNSDGSMVFVGETNSNDMDVSGHHGLLTTTDVWLVKLGSLISGLYDLTDDMYAVTLYPNPAGDYAAVSFELDHNEHVRIDVLDLRGRIIRTVLDEERNPGLNRITLELDKLSIEGGMYFIHTIVGKTSYTRKLITY